MPVSCKLRGDKWRICEADDTIAKTENGNPRDGGGHATEEECQAQARAINRNMMAIPVVSVLRRWSMAEMDQEPNGRPVEIIYVGTFHLADRNRVLEISRDHLEQMVKNFKELDGPDRIAFNVNHHSHASTLEEARAVGWLQDLLIREQDGRISLLGVPRWLDDARVRLEEEQFKYLSAEIDFNATDCSTGEKCGCRLLGIAITNTPAIPDLSPIQLSMYGDNKTWRDWFIARSIQLVQMNQGKSLVEQRNKLVDAFFRAFPGSNIEEYYPEDIRDKCLIIRVIPTDQSPSQLYQVDYQVNDKEITFPSRDRWIAVEQQYVPLAANISVENSAAKDGADKSGAALGGTPTNEETFPMEEKLRNLLGLSAEDSIETAIAALIQAKADLEAQIATLSSQFQQEKENATTALTTKQGEIETLSTQVTVWKTEVEKLSQQVKGLMNIQHQRETEDRIFLNLRAGRLTRAEIEANGGYLRQLADTQPEVFDLVMATRPSRPELFREIGSGTEPPLASVDEIFTLTAQEREAALKSGNLIDDEEALRRVFVKRPDLEKLQYEGGR